MPIMCFYLYYFDNVMDHDEWSLNLRIVWISRNTKARMKAQLLGV